MTDWLRQLTRIRWWVWLIIGLLSLLVVSVLSFFVWVNIPQGRLMPEAQDALVSDEQVSVDDAQWLVFSPVDSPTAGFLLYPGERTQPAAYAPLLRDIAEAGYLAVGIPVQLNMALFDIEAAAPVIEAYPQIEHWAVAGHSMGGLAASSFALRYPDDIDGLVLMGALPAPATEFLATYEHLHAALIYGTADGLLPPEEAAQALAGLPEETLDIAIEGGNHAGFGWYGDQPGDQPARIARAEQQAQTLDAVLSIMARMTE